MGHEFILAVSENERESVARVLDEHLQPLFERLDPKAQEDFPNVFGHRIPEGALLCDNLSDTVVFFAILGALTHLMLRHATSVSVYEA